MTSAGWPGLGSSSKESRPRLNSADHFATVEYFGLLSPYTSAMRRWISLAFASSLVRNLWLLWTQYSDFPFLPMGIGFQTKSKSKKCMCWLNGCYHSTDKGLHCTKMKKRNLELYWKILSSTNLLNYPRTSSKCHDSVNKLIKFQENISNSFQVTEGTKKKKKRNITETTKIFLVFKGP